MSAATPEPIDLQALWIAWSNTLANDTWPDNNNEFMLLKAIPQLLAELTTLRSRVEELQQQYILVMDERNAADDAYTAIEERAEKAEQERDASCRWSAIWKYVAQRHRHNHLAYQKLWLDTTNIERMWNDLQAVKAENTRLSSALAGVREASQPIVDLLDAIDASEFARGAFARYDDDAALYEYLGGGEYVKVTWSQIRALRAAALPPGGGDTPNA